MAAGFLPPPATPRATLLYSMAAIDSTPVPFGYWLEWTPLCQRDYSPPKHRDSEVEKPVAENRWDEPSAYCDGSDGSCVSANDREARHSTEPHSSAQHCHATFPRVEPEHGKDGALSFLRFLPVPKGAVDPHRGSEKSHWLFQTHRFFYWCGSLRPNILCDSHCLPDCLRLIIQIDHNSLCGGLRGGEGYAEPLGWLGKVEGGSLERGGLSWRSPPRHGLSGSRAEPVM